MFIIRKLSRITRRLFEFVLVVSLAALALSVLAQIVLRQALSHTFLPLDDIIPYAFSVSTFVGAALLFGEGGHISITVFSDLVPERMRRPVIWFAGTMSAAFLLFLLVYGYEFTVNGLHQFSPLLGMRLCYVYSVVPVSALGALLFMATEDRGEGAAGNEK